MMLFDEVRSDLYRGYFTCESFPIQCHNVTIAHAAPTIEEHFHDRES
jgi:hypothetical protein